MTPDKVCSVLSGYGDLLTEAGYYAERLDQEAYERFDVTRFHSLCHCHWMCNEARDFVRQGRIEKAMRWLGYIQGVLYSYGIKSLSQLKSDSMP